MESSQGAELIAWATFAIATITAIPVVISILFALHEYRLKMAAERRQWMTAEVEAEIRLHKIFGELMSTAHGREDYYFSEELAKMVFEELKSSGMQDNAKINKEIVERSVFTRPIGIAQQQAAIASITRLACAYPQLRKPALEAFNNLGFPPNNDLVQRCRLEIVEAERLGAGR